ncbi:Metallo-dependent phosphatase [Obba rivulosa]|uniref:Metallo-dependent phosphatase n=1 Tax=Obba rivulosa TaxID=1052685 RepID=A0A8E2J4K2_9APHY|nr:Metallo-dependent phosphatase [Obba rivulosa]
MADEAHSSVELECQGAKVYLDYDIHDPPPRPDSNWTRFVCISDSHAKRFAVPDGDVLLHSGDLTYYSTLSDFEATLEWLKELPHPIKIVIGGNHDFALHTQDGWYDMNYQRWHMGNKQDVSVISNLFKGDSAKRSGIVYLENEQHQFRVKDHAKIWSVYGSPWTPAFYDWAFNYSRGKEAENLVSTFPQTDVLLTHGPPFRILDQVLSGGHVGCEALATRLPDLRPRLHVFGHIHEAHGALIREWAANSDAGLFGETKAATSGKNTVFVNAANFPLGPRARTSDGQEVPVGGAPFQPVIVDLFD